MTNDRPPTREKYDDPNRETTTLSTLGGDLLSRPHDGRKTLADAGNHAQADDIVLVAKKGDRLTAPTARPTDVPATTPPETPEQKQQREYKEARDKYNKELNSYWDDVQQSKRNGKMVQEFPPLYKGPEKPKGPDEPKAPSTLPSLNDILTQSKELNRLASGDKTKPDFKLNEVDERSFKQSYAREADRVGKKNGLTSAETREIAHRIYAFEDGGWGTHDMLSGMRESMMKDDKPGETKLRDEKMNFHPASTAIGYTQMLLLNTVANIHKDPGFISNRLQEMAKENPGRANELNEKAKLIQSLSKSLDTELKNMAEANKNGPVSQRKAYLDKNGEPTEALYYDFAKSQAKTASGLTGRQYSSALHSFHLDGDVGPILQTHELDNLLQYAKAKDFKGMIADRNAAVKQNIADYDALPGARKTAAVAEVMALVKPSSGADPQAFGLTKDSVQKKLLALKSGTQPELAKDKLTAPEYELMNQKLLTLRRFGEPGGKLSNDARLLLDKTFVSHFGELSPAKGMPAALELANLAGSGKALAMLKTANADYPTVNFFARNGYEANPVTNRRSADELYMYIHRVMHGPNSDASNKPGVQDMLKAFEPFEKANSGSGHSPVLPMKPPMPARKPDYPAHHEPPPKRPPLPVARPRP